jgi:hypothetical protein
MTADTSTQATNRGGANDEINVAVVDEDGAFTGIQGSVIEVFPNVSKAYDAKDNDGNPNYVSSVVNNNSNYIWIGNIESLWNSATTQDLTTTFPDINVGFTAAEFSKFSLSGGTGSTASNANLYIGGYSKFADRDSVDVSLIISGRADTTNVKLLGDLVDTRKDCVLFVSPALSDVQNRTQVNATQLALTRRNSLYNINSS